mgnify:FL=1
MFSEVFQMDKILGFCEKLWYVIGANLLFLLSNLPALLFFLFVGASQVRTCLPFFLLCMVPAGPALAALFYTMNRLLSKTETGVWRDYRKAYRDDWGQKYLLAAGHMFLILVFEINIEFFAVQIPVFPLMILFVILFAAALAVTPNLYLLASRYRMKNRDIVKTSLILLVTRPVSTLGSIVSLGVILMLFELKAGTAVLFMGSLYGFLIAFMNRKVLHSLEES